MQRINLSQLRKIIAEEIDSAINEGERSAINHTQVASVATAASKLLTAIDAFNKAATGAMVNAVTPAVDNVKKALEQMIDTPSAYVDRNAQKKVTFKASSPAK
jgi:hypothetical protein